MENGHYASLNQAVNGFEHAFFWAKSYYSKKKYPISLILHQWASLYLNFFPMSLEESWKGSKCQNALEEFNENIKGSLVDGAEEEALVPSMHESIHAD